MICADPYGLHVGSGVPPSFQSQDHFVTGPQVLLLRSIDYDAKFDLLKGEHHFPMSRNSGCFLNLVIPKTSRNSPNFPIEREVFFANSWGPSWKGDRTTCSKRMSRCGARLRMRQHIPKRHRQQTGGEFLPQLLPLLTGKCEMDRFRHG